MPPNSGWEKAVRLWHYRRFNRSKPRDARFEYSNDYDRVLYSTAFRRLGGVTQVAASSEIALFHNRLTHAIKTAQVGARISNHIIKQKYPDPDQDERRAMGDYGGLEPRIVRAACLAYNLGRPPFGQVAVEELQRITTDPNRISPKRNPSAIGPKYRPQVAEGYLLAADSFHEGAQSFRIVSKLAFREPRTQTGGSPALDLCRGTLAALLKYPWCRDENVSGIQDTNTKWGYYRSEQDVVRWLFDGDVRPPGRELSVVRGRTAGNTTEYRTIEAQVRDWADDISYAIHDVEDFFRVGLIPLNYLVLSEAEWGQFFEYAWSRKLSSLFGSDRHFAASQAQIVREKFFPKTPYEGTQADRIALHKFASVLIDEARDNTDVTKDGVLKVADEQVARIELLKQLTWYYVIERPSLESLQRGQRALIRSLYNHLIEWVEELWDGEPPTNGTISGQEDQSTRRRGPGHQLPARLIEYLEVAKYFDPKPRTVSKDWDAERQVVSRAVVDYIASLTELQTVELNTRLSGQSTNSMLDSWFLP